MSDQKDLKACGWSYLGNEEPCWGEIDSTIDAFYDGDGDDYVAAVTFCSGHKNFALHEDEGYIPEPAKNQ